MLGLDPLNEHNKLFSSSGGHPLENTGKLLAKIEKNLGAVVCALNKLPLCYCYQARLRKAARELLEYGESRDGYQNSDKFMKQIEKAVQVSRG